MAVSFSYSNASIQKSVKNKNSIKGWIKDIIENNFKKNLGDVNYLFTNDTQILEINRKYLNHDYYTDIITFSYSTENIISADIVISIDTVRSNANSFGQEFEIELRRVIIHGILHALGFEDKTEEQKKSMTELENWALNLYAEKWK